MIDIAIRMDLRRRRGKGHNASNGRAEFERRLRVHQDVDSRALRFHEL